jgi:RimJ/RimL family protein N-acetyltransferase
VAIEQLRTERLLLRPPRPEDAASIFARYSSDADVTRFVGWPRHRSVEDATAFVGFSDDEWTRRRCGPYLIWDRSSSVLLGGTGLSLEAPHRAATGYVLAKDAWGRGLASEALNAMIEAARRIGITQIYAICHADHHASAHVLEKCHFSFDRTVPALTFPNLSPSRADGRRYIRTIGRL